MRKGVKMLKEERYYGVRSPLSVQLELTHKCNVNCIFCHNDLNRLHTISFDDAEKIINKLGEAKVFYLIFTGGEPLLHPDLPKFISLARDNGMEVGLITNGYLLEERYEEIKKSGGIDRLQISISGYDRATHDSITGVNGSFDKAISAIEKLASDGFKQINVNTTLIRNNIEDIDKIMRVVKEKGATSYTVTRYIPVNNKDIELIPTIKQINTALRKLISWSNDFPIRITTALPYCCIDNDINLDKLKKILAGCDGGLTWATISPTGDLVPCPCWHNYCGNVFEDSISKLWQENDFLINLRTGNMYPDECKSCKHFNECRGGCRSCSSNWSGELNGFDPYYSQNQISIV